MEQLTALAEKLSSSDDEIRRMAVISLAQHPWHEAQALLFRALGDSSWRVRKEATDAVIEAVATNEDMEGLVALLRAQDNAGLRNSAVEALCRIGERALPVLSRYMNDQDHDVRKFVVDIVGDIGSPDSLSLLLQVLEDEDLNVCAAAIENIGKLRNAAAHVHLVKCLAKPDMMIRFAALEALARLGKPVPLAELLPLLRENLLKKGVYDCLGNGRDVAAVPHLIEGLRESRSVREAAAAALVRIRNSSSETGTMVDDRLARLKGSPVVEGLVASLATATERQVKENVMTLLACIGDERAASPILQEASAGAFSALGRAAFAAMGKAGEAFLINAFTRGNEAERRYIAYLCGELAIPESVDLLWQGMRDRDPDLRAVCAAAAGRMEQAGLMDQVVSLLDDPAPEVRAASIGALSALARSAGDTLVKLAEAFFSSALPEKRSNAATLFTVLGDVERLSILVKDEDVTVRTSAVNALAQVGAKEGMHHLVLALADEDPDVRSAAVQALGKAGGAEVLEPLVLSLKDEDMWVRVDALKSLGTLGDERACEAVAEMVESGEPPVVIAALETIALLRGSDATGILVECLNHEDEEVVKASVELLSEMDGSWVEECKSRLLKHPHWDVRRAFVRTLAMLRGAGAVPDLQAALASESDELVRRLLAELLERLQ